MGNFHADFEQFFGAKKVKFVMIGQEKEGYDGKVPRSVSVGGFAV